MKNEDSPKNKKTAPKISFKQPITTAADPWGGSTTNSNTNQNFASPFGTTNEWPSSPSSMFPNSSSSSGRKNFLFVFRNEFKLFYHI